jgi:hypothetical protein
MDWYVVNKVFADRSMIYGPRVLLVMLKGVDRDRLSAGWWSSAPSRTAVTSRGTSQHHLGTKRRSTTTSSVEIPLSDVSSRGIKSN